MGDARFTRHYEEVVAAQDPLQAIGGLTDEGVISALAAASRAQDPYLANVLATEALNRTRRKNQIIYTAGEGLLAIDGLGRLTFLNPAAERMLGWTQAELVGEDVHESIHCKRPDGTPYPRDDCPIGRVLLTGDLTSSQGDEFFVRKDGSFIPVAFTCSPILQDGEVNGMVVVFRDISERREAEERLRASEARTRAVLEATLGNRLDVGRLGGEVAVAREPLRQERGLLWRAFVEDINAAYARALDYASIGRLTQAILWVHFVALTVLALVNASEGVAAAVPSPFGWRAISGDEAAAALTLGFLLSGLPMVLKDRMGSHYAWRLLTTASLVGYSALFVFVSGGSIEMHFHFFIVIAYVAIWSDWRLGWLVLVFATLHHVVLNALAPDWIYMYGRNDLAGLAHASLVLAAVLATSALCRNQRNTVVSLEAARSTLVEDLVARKRAEKARAESEERLLRLNDTLEERVTERTRALAQANRELESFSDSVSHDLRAPLRAIEAMGAALAEDYEGNLDTEGKACLHRIRSESQRATQMVNALLELARAAQSDVRREPVDVSALALEVGEAVCAKDPSRRVSFYVAREVRADADPRLLRVVLENLIGNAFKYSAKVPEALIEVGSFVEAGERVYFVRDNGAGFDMTRADHLFQPFRRLHTSHEFEGTGVGLATVQRILARHGGRAWAHGKVGEGATFYFTLGERVRPAPNPATTEG
ncbi:MAG TPA: ATP-binding protein [Candidatus Thermoplasmatota archaeon]|nr:ATP-binding protein [Candidatus Thermoplasmatota archaeon]